MKISISNLSEGVHEFHFSAEPSHFGLGDNFTKEVAVDARVDKTSREISVKAVATAVGTFTCDRCVDEFVRQVIATYQMVYIYGENDKRQYSDGEVQTLALGTPFIDITDDIREYILLAIPLKLLCKENCKGLCPNCGTNRNHERCPCTMEEVDPSSQTLKKHFPN